MVNVLMYTSSTGLMDNFKMYTFDKAFVHRLCAKSHIFCSQTLIKLKHNSKLLKTNSMLKCTHLQFYLLLTHKLTGTP